MLYTQVQTPLKIVEKRARNNKFDTHTHTHTHTHTSREPWTFTTKKNEACSFLINGVTCK